jgi:5-(carboxyamino)imidazole ribonucleotide mutase
MVASMTHLPVLGVPMQSKALSGQDRCCRSCRCLRAFPWARWPSASRAPPTRACWRPRSWPPDPALAERVKAFRTAQTEAVAERPEVRDPTG